MGLSGLGRESELWLGLYPLNGHVPDNLREKSSCFCGLTVPHLLVHPSPHRPLGRMVLRDNLSSLSVAGDRGRDEAVVCDLLLS